MRKHTTLNIDADLLAEAQRELGTTSATETIHRALRETINLRSRQRLMALDLSSLTEGDLENMRRNRDFSLTGERLTI